MARKLESVSKLRISLHHISHPQPYSEENEKVFWQHVKTPKSLPPTPTIKQRPILLTFHMWDNLYSSRCWGSCCISKMSSTWTQQVLNSLYDPKSTGNANPWTRLWAPGPYKTRKQSRTVRVIIQDPGTSGAKHPASPDCSVWASWVISKVLQPSPVFHQEDFICYPSTQTQTFKGFANHSPT